jgi:hypothetical protein
LSAAAVGIAAAPAQAASAAPPNGGPVTVVVGTSPSHGRVGLGSGQVGTSFTLTPVKGGCPHPEDAPLVIWKAPYTEIAISFTPGSATGFMPTGAPRPGMPAARPGTYSARLECLSTTPEDKTSVDKVFAPASITLTGKQLLPSLSRTSVRRGGTLGIALPGVCGKAGASRFTFVDLVAKTNMPVANLTTGNPTIPNTVAPGRYFVTAQCETGAVRSGMSAGYSYGFAPLTVTS